MSIYSHVEERAQVFAGDEAVVMADVAICKGTAGQLDRGGTLVLTPTRLIFAAPAQGAYARETELIGKRVNLDLSNVDSFRFRAGTLQDKIVWLYYSNSLEVTSRQGDSERFYLARPREWIERIAELRHEARA
jgi:hypothetical protein